MSYLKEPGRLIISLALLVISVVLIVAGEIPAAVMLAASVAAAWGIEQVRNNHRGGPSSPS